MKAQRESRLTLSFILITVLLDMIGFGIILPVLPNLIEEITGESIARTAVLGGYLLFIYALMQFAFSPILGNLSDRFGRRPILLLSLVGLTIDYTIMGLAPTLIWLFVGRTLSGISGAAVSTATAYIADISPREKRSSRFGLIGAAYGLGFVIGPLVGGELGELSPRAPFFAAAILAFANLLFGYFILPESLSMRKRRRFKIQRANPFGAILALRQMPGIIWLLAVLFLFAIAGQALPSVWNFFTIEKLEWSTSQVGRSLAYFGLLFALSQAFLIGPVVKRIGEGWTLLLGIIAATTAFLGLTIIETYVGLYVCLTIGALSGIALPALTGLLSHRVPDSSQGELQGAIHATNSMTAIIGPIAATQLFSYFTVSNSAPFYFPAAPFAAAGVAVGLSAIVFLIAAFRHNLFARFDDDVSHNRPVVAHPGEISSPPRKPNSADGN
jgi:DHA1 family tetracycline resistance protein-like MFS transporter